MAWYCQNYRKTKDIPDLQKKFCNVSIQGIRLGIDNFEFEFYEKKKHSEVCIDLIQKKIKENKNIDIPKSTGNKEANEINKEIEMISKIESKKDLNKYLENYLLKYKNIIITCNEFIKFLKNLYFNNHLNNKFEIKETMFKNIYYKIKRNLDQLNLEDIYKYAKKLSNGEYFCRYIGYKLLISKDKK